MAVSIERARSALAGRYRIERELGRGGMATVFLGQDVRQHRAVAIKILEPELEAAIGSERFLREIQVTGGLTHPHILALHDSGSAGGLLYYVMPYVEGESLRERLKREKQLPLGDALQIARGVASALDYANRHGLVHRDIKPENILLSGNEVMVADFGIVRALAAAAESELTPTGVAVGTPVYMSPEQAAGSKEIDGRSDLYSLGCVLYEMLAGDPPFTGPTAQAIQARHLFDPVPPLRTVRPSVPERVEQAVTKALAKVPADRYATAAEFAASLAGTEVATTTLGPRSRHWRAWAAIGTVLGIAFLGSIIGWPRLSTLIHERSAAGSGKRDWILVAEFDGPADDPGLAVAARELVSAGLDQSKIVAAIPRGQLKDALRLAGKPDTTRVDAAVARELAYRSAVRAVVEGHIGRLGNGYSIVLRVTNAEDGTPLLSVSDAAKSQDELIPAFGRLTRKLRDGLGERRSDFEATRSKVEVITPSFDAYRRYVRARAMQNDESDDRGSIAMSREALAIDPAFAAAWGLIGYAFNHLGEFDSSQKAVEEALRRPDRLTEEGHLFMEGIAAEYRNDLLAAFAARDRMVRDYATPAAYGNRGVILEDMGRYEEALKDEEQAVRLEPFAPRQWILFDQFECLIILGRLAEAKDVAAKLKGRNARLAPLGMAVAGADWARAESCATTLVGDLTATDDVRITAAIAIASEEAARGDVGASGRMLDQALRMAEVGNRSAVQAIARAQLLMRVASGTPVHALNAAMARDTSVAGLITQGWWAAVASDTNRARRLLRRVQTRPKVELAWHGAGPVLLEAWIAARTGHRDETVRTLGPAARQGAEFGFVPDRIGGVPMRWLMGNAYERLGRPDSAAAYYELALLPKRMYWRDQLSVRMVSSFAHQRLVLLYARLGRVADAERHWKIFSATFTHPDRDMQPLLEEARAALMGARGMIRAGKN